MARAMWKGAIQFGLVTIPVKLYLATDSKGISFNMLHATDLSRIQMKTYCPVDDEVISRSDTVRGFEYAPGEYVVVTDEDLERVPLKTVRSIEIEQFTKATRDEGPIRFVKSAYYLEPDKIGQKAFGLLKSVLKDKGLTAICKVVIKDREALAALDPFENTMLLTTLHWPDEIRATADLDLPEAEQEFKPAEKAMAEQLVAAMTGDFDAAAVSGRVPRGAHGRHRREGRRPRDQGPDRAAADRQPRRPHGRARGERQRREEVADRCARVGDRGTRRQGQGRRGEDTVEEGRRRRRDDRRRRSRGSTRPPPQERLTALAA